MFALLKKKTFLSQVFLNFAKSQTVDDAHSRGRRGQVCDLLQSLCRYLQCSCDCSKDFDWNKQCRNHQNSACTFTYMPLMPQWQRANNQNKQNQLGQHFFFPIFFLLFLHYIYFFIGIRRSRKCFAVEKLVAEMVDICGSGGNFEKGRVCRFSTVDQRRIGGKE